MTRERITSSGGEPVVKKPKAGMKVLVEMTLLRPLMHGEWALDVNGQHSPVKNRRKTKWWAEAFPGAPRVMVCTDGL